MRIQYRLLIAVLLALTAAWAQGPRGRQTAPRGGQGQPLLDLARQVEVEGTVTAVNIALGAQYPSIEVNKTLIKVAPVWFMLENDFELVEGDTVKVMAAPSLSPSDPYLHALQIVNTATQAQITLRSSFGTPLWTARGSREFGRDSGRQVHRGYGSGYAGCLDPASITTVSGVVESVNMGVGITQPALVIRLADNSLVTVKIGPERILLENEFVLNQGEPVTAKIGLAACKDEIVALELTNADGVTVVLRTDLGAPAWD
jgi:hypothetical protein